MNPIHRKNKKDKAKSNDGNCRNNHRIEALKATIEQKKQCNSRALQIVVRLSEETVSEDCLIENLQFINQEHYQDIIEERAINKLCGYPICASKLKNIPAKQYQISTIHNKVFDITDRKNFCSNLCYKASKYLKDQISTSPLWLRENSASVFKLISLHSKGGIAGEEVDFGHSPIKADDVISSNDDTCLTHLNQSSESTLKGSKSDSKNKSTQINFGTNIETKVDTLPLFESVKDNSRSIPVTINENEPISADLFTSIDLPKRLNFSDYQDQSRLSDDQESPQELKVPLSKCSVNDNSNELISVPTKQLNSENNKPNVRINQDTVPKVSTVEHNYARKQKTVLNSHKISSKRKTNIKHSHNYISPIQNVVLKIEHVLKEWFNMDSFCFIFGEEKIKELLLEERSCIAEYSNIVGGAGNSLFYERYLAICKKLNILELEDTKTDASFREEAKKPLPNYEELKEEAKDLELKVKMFYRGDKLVHFEEAQGNSQKNESEQGVVEPILPLVDLHAQKALRRRIVNDSLRRVIQDLQISLGLRGFNLYEDVRQLVSTFSLSAHNITMKPGEWHLIAIILIKLLSLKDKNLEQALNSNSTNKHLILLLMSYSLDGGYLDRLVEWLTDIDTLLQKN